MLAFEVLASSDPRSPSMRIWPFEVWALASPSRSVSSMEPFAGLGIQAAVQGLHADLRIGGVQPRRSAAILGADGAVGSENAVQVRRARDLDDETRSHVAAAVRRARHADGNRIGAVVDGDFQRVGGFLGGGVLGAADVDGLLVQPEPRRTR